ncbi:DNA repair protein complementing XP-A cells homolog [Thrips palmi]|uniref:DNA repair protein complementing XP-A cells homolog n=1 Tax=Thrips palmi TaxID=161013 RepID=A0A6P8Z3N0_THRPL|nr:DNA repair protein complementing XP-A cells homolog [Thrips palmi]
MSEEGEVDVKPDVSNTLTPAQLAMIERNRQRAIEIRRAKLMPHPYAKVDKGTAEKTVVRSKSTKVIDTGGGFLLEETDDPDQNKETAIVKEPGPILPPDCPVCEECQQEFSDSWLLKSFDHSVCDGCRDNDDKHALITKTDAKTEYLLKDCDLDKREPILKYIVRKNPHNPRWGDMKLYLHVQIEKRALEVWKSEEALLEYKEMREEKRNASKVKKYNKQLKALRMNVRSSLYDRTSAAAHTHTFGPESYNEEDDNYTRTCSTCQFVDVFEKM